MTAIHPRLTVLLAEDDDNDVLLIRRAFEKLGVVRRLICVSDGEQVLSYFQALGNYRDRQRYPAPDLLVLDHWMPRVSGLDVLFWLRTQLSFKQLPVVVLSVGLAPREAVILHTLKAVYCLKSCSHQDMMRNLDDGVRAALGSVTEGSSVRLALRPKSTNHPSIAARN